MKIASKQHNLCIISTNPRFKYNFKKADVPLEIKESHTEKILKNKNFYVSDKPIKVKKVAQIKPKDKITWSEELEAIKGIGKKRAEDIVIVYPTKGDLLKKLSKKQKIPFRDDIVEILKNKFIH